MELKQCPDNNILADYIGGGLLPDEMAAVEKHVSGCKNCLQKISLALKADRLYKEGRLPAASPAAVQKAKQILGSPRPKTQSWGRPKSWRHLWLMAAIAAFTLSFVFPKYFIQCLVATILLGIKWIIESENMRTLILVLDSWRKHQHNRDEEISQRLKERTNIRTLK